MIENCSDGTFSVLYFSIEVLFSLASYINFEHKVKGDHTLSELAGQTSPVIRRIPVGTPVVTQLLVTANKLPDILSSGSSNWGNPNNRCSL